MPDDIVALADGDAAESGHSLYEADEHAWIAAQVAALAEGDWGNLDRVNLIEFLNAMALRDRRELESRLVVLLHHLLKVQLQPEKLTRSWVMPIIEQQREIKSFIKGIPSLRREVPAMATVAYPDAVRSASRETGISETRFPPTLPWTVEEILAFDPPEPVSHAPRGRRRG